VLGLAVPIPKALHLGELSIILYKKQKALAGLKTPEALIEQNHKRE
jgi:hypothetical protein